MYWNSRTSVVPVRSCPVCGSGAVAALHRVASDTALPPLRTVPFLVLCGECETWRRCRLRRAAARGFKRHLRRDRRRLRRTLRHAGEADFGPELARLSPPASSQASRRTSLA